MKPLQRMVGGKEGKTTWHVGLLVRLVSLPGLVCLGCSMMAIVTTVAFDDC